ncbi:MAG: biotin--[acetyl-CoA-carboxylase] ligase [Bacteroidales bacterium]|jgi:BirA family biotin operon repressor/biotin-[acetyl-CoA-carboxylase] ligase|nr:biotin--[acetyl-CoA-carboxylase] ligase [Bacteroidales bacterium]
MAIDIIWLDTIDSTNKEILRRSDELTDFTILAAEYQSEGRGQKGTSWESAKGTNLTFSLLLKPDMIKAENQFIISQIAAVGVYEYLKSKGVEAKIKWPNDIYVEDKKIAGILIENAIEGDSLSESVVGIGLNLNQDKFESNAPNPVSLKKITGKEYDLKEELEKLAFFLYDLYIPFKNFSWGSISEKISTMYHRNLYRYEEIHKFQETPSGEVFEGRIIGTDKNACLQIEKLDGSVVSYAFKEVKYII